MSYTNISFKSVGELVDYVLAGNELYNPTATDHIKVSNGIVRWEDNEAVYITSALSLDWLVKQEWYENIPERGVLCHVPNESDEFDYSVVAIMKTTKNQGHCRKYRSSFAWHQEAKPLTNEEIKSFLVEESSDDWRDSVSEENPVECYVGDCSAYLNPDNCEDLVNIIEFESSFDHPYSDDNHTSWRYAVPVNPKIRIK